MNELKIFSNPQFGEIRTVTEDGVTLFCGSDVAKALGYKNPSKAVNDHCKGVTKRYTPTAGGRQALNFIPEGDIYRLAAKSELPGAEAFERWIFDEVLPAIRLTGSYTVRALEKDLEVNTVPFLGADILTARDMDGQIWVGVASVCRGLGLNKGQADIKGRALNKDPDLSPGVGLFPVGTAGSYTRLLKLEYVPLWLARVTVTPALRLADPRMDERLTEYRLKLRDAVAAALLDTGKIPLMQAVVKLEQRQKAQDYAMQNLASRLALLEGPAEPRPAADVIHEAESVLKIALEEIRELARRCTLTPQAVPDPPLPPDPLWQTRCHGVLYRAAKKAGKKVEFLERETCLEAASRTGMYLEPGRGMMDEVAGNAVLRDAYIQRVNELALQYNV